VPKILPTLMIGLIVTWSDQAWADASVAKGRELAARYCMGCHVVGTENRLGGIDSTPSFFLMSEKIANYRQRLLSLKSRPPHTAYERLEDISNEDIADVIAYIGKLERP